MLTTIARTTRLSSPALRAGYHTTPRIRTKGITEANKVKNTLYLLWLLWPSCPSYTSVTHSHTFSLCLVPREPVALNNFFIFPLLSCSLFFVVTHFAMQPFTFLTFYLFQAWSDVVSDMRAASTYKNERIITTPQNASIKGIFFLSP